MEVKAIETVYAGCRFRSRLEARWAVFFDHLKVKWQYEPQGFEKGEYRYLPDFRLDLSFGPTWVEVKGDRNWMRDNSAKICDWFAGDPIIPGRAAIILGEIPAPADGALMFRAFGHSSDDIDNLPWLAVSSSNDGFGLSRAGALLKYFRPDLCKNESEFQPFIIPAMAGYPALASALTAARSARFEFGESGAPRS